MKQLSLVLSVATILGVGFASTASASSFQIGSGLFDAANGHTYYVIGENDPTSTLTWENAEAFAQTLGGHLAEVNDANENAFIFNMFATYGALLTANSQQTDFWYFGLTDTVVEGTFRWVIDGSIVGSATNPFTNWNAGEPNNDHGNEDWAGMLLGSGLWNDGTDGFPGSAGVPGLRYASIAEVAAVPNPTAVPEPMSVLLVGTGIATFISERRRRQTRQPR